MSEKLKIAINGFGRIGRSFFRVAHQAGLEIVAINDLIPIEQSIYLLKYDSVYGRFAGDVRKKGKGMLVDGHLIPKLDEKEPAKLPWKELDIDLVIESTGFFTDPDQAQAHIEAGAKLVIITAPIKGKGQAKTIILGVNEADFKPGKDQVISMASCTTNCLTPIVKVLEESFGVEKSLMTTIHSYTATQALQDGPNKDFRRGRAGALNLVPTTTGASKATELAYPKIKGNLDGLAIRVPTPTVSLVDLVALLKKETTPKEVNQIFKISAKEKNYQGAIEVSKEPLVSTDLRGDPHAAIIDLPSTRVIGGNLVKVIAWYDNEMGYSARLAKFCKYIQGLE